MSESEQVGKLKLRCLVGLFDERRLVYGGGLDAETYAAISAGEWREQYVEPWEEEHQGVVGEMDWRECWITVEVPPDMFAALDLPSKVELPETADV